jgi:hypothetical protein
LRDTIAIAIPMDAAHLSISLVQSLMKCDTRKRQIGFPMERRKLDVEREEDRMGVYGVTRGL